MVSLSKMQTSATAPAIWNWRRFALKWLCVGVGIGLISVVAIGSLIWWNSRPKPAMRWNVEALVAKTPPSFSVDNTGKKLELWYNIENTTENDYQFDTAYELKILIKTSDGSFSQPLPDDALHIEVPVFIPAKQVGTMTLKLTISGIPIRHEKETDDEYHERVRAFCETRLSEVKGFTLFDGVKRYRVDLPRWLSQKPKGGPA